MGAEIRKRRPVLIVSNNANNRSASTVTVLPITSNVSRVFPFEALLDTQETRLTKPSKAQAQQIRTIAKERIRGRRVGRIGEDTLRRVEEAMRLHLDCGIR